MLEAIRRMEEESLNKKIKAAVVIQSYWRGFKLRKGLFKKGKGKKVNMGDAKQLYEAGLAAMKVLFGGQLVEHPVVAGLLFSEGEVLDPSML